MLKKLHKVLEQNNNILEILKEMEPKKPLTNSYQSKEVDRTSGEYRHEAWKTFLHVNQQLTKTANIRHSGKKRRAWWKEKPNTVESKYVRGGNAVFLQGFHRRWKQKTDMVEVKFCLEQGVTQHFVIEEQ